MAGSFTTSYSVGGDLDKVKEISNVKVVDEIKEIGIVTEIGGIRGFATKTQPFNIMYCYDIPAIKDRFEFDIELPNKEVEILATTVTCSGYGEMDKYDLFFNEQQWFSDWYCSETKEGLFMGTSTYVYAAPAGAVIHLVFKNDSGTSKKVWFGVRMLVD